MTNIQSILIRSTIKPSDIEEIIALHGTLYHEDYGFDKTFKQ